MVAKRVGLMAAMSGEMMVGLMVGELDSLMVAYLEYWKVHQTAD